jgi:hypothetical protein
MCALCDKKEQEVDDYQYRVVMAKLEDIERLTKKTMRAAEDAERAARQAETAAQQARR